MSSAAAFTLSESTVVPHAFHEFQPSGGVSASLSVPPTIVSCCVAEPFAPHAEIHDRAPGARERPGDDAGLRVEREAGRQVARNEGERTLTCCGNLEQERPARRCAGDTRA